MRYNRDQYEDAVVTAQEIQEQIIKGLEDALSDKKVDVYNLRERVKDLENQLKTAKEVIRWRRNKL